MTVIAATRPRPEVPPTKVAALATEQKPTLGRLIGRLRTKPT
ncbi:hypothetical protein [Qipengyuania atrilutea]|nr:hypothetical protein [Actirhodobacter atriluteus]